MVGVLLLILLLVVLFGALGLAVSPWFFVLLVAALLLGTTGSFYGHRR